MRDVMARLDNAVINDVANKPIAPLEVDEVVRVASKCTIPPFSHKVIHGKVKLVLHGCRLNVMTYGLEKRSPSLPLGIDVQTAYSTLANGSHRVPVVLRNNTLQNANFHLCKMPFVVSYNYFIMSEVCASEEELL